MSDPNTNRPGYKETKVGWIPEEWEAKQLGKTITLKRGYDLPHSDRTAGKIPVVSSAGCIAHHNIAKCSPPGIVTGRYGSIGEVHFINEEYWPLNTTLYGQDFHGNHPMFLYHLLSAFNFKQFSDKTGVPGVNRNDLHRELVRRPPLSEQKKIAEILSTCDEAIEKTSQLIEAKQRQKKALMQQLLTGKKRLPGFEGEWIDTKLGEICERVTRKNIKNCQNNLTISGPLGLINQEEYFKKRIASKDVSGYFLLYKGEFAYNKSYCKGYPLGAIKMLHRYNEGVVSTLYICFRLKPKSANPDFIRHFFESSEFNHELYAIAQEGARNHGLLNVAPNDFFNTRLTLPSQKEQQAISQIMENAQSEVSTLQQKLASLRQQKKALMQKLLTGQVRVKH
ncbi:MAG: restriction endonuclease subunit S [Verrucomicrobiota bacterium]